MKLSEIELVKAWTWATYISALFCEENDSEVKPCQCQFPVHQKVKQIAEETNEAKHHCKCLSYCSKANSINSPDIQHDIKIICSIVLEMEFFVHAFFVDFLFIFERITGFEKIRDWSWWRRGVVVITNAQLHSTKPELRFCAGSKPACCVSEIRNGEDLWQWSRLEIRLNAFRRSTIPQKQFIIITIIIISV